MYHQHSQFVNRFASAPRDIVYLFENSNAVRRPFNPHDEWFHVLVIGFEGFRADRIGQDIVITGSRRAGFVGGNA